MMVFVLAIVILMPAVGMAEAATAAPADDTGGAVVEIPGVEVGEPLTWTYLATIAGAAAFTLLVVQFLKAPLDKVWKIPTRVFAYVVALGVMLVATAFTTGLTVDNALLVGSMRCLRLCRLMGPMRLRLGR